MQVPPPKDWQVFERHLRDLLEAHWKSPATMHGRTGQPQHGVDIYGQPDGDAYHGVQCKGHDGNLNASVTETELKAEIGKAKKFTPRIAHFILATTAPRDAKIQAVVRRLNKRKTKPFPVEVLFWDDILAIYGQHPDVFHRHYPFVSPAPDRLHQLPAAPVDFTGRDAELAKLLDMIHTAGACITGLHGLGGVGKTALALVLAHQVKDAYPAAQLFVELHGTTDTPLPPADALKRAIQGFEPETKLPETAEELRPRYLSLLHGKKALILADNAAGPEHVRPLIPPPGCLLLVTSRRHFKVEGLFDLRLDTLPESDALKLLLAICDRIADHAGPIAKLCGYLPLALRAAASLLSVRLDIAVDAYVRDLADERTRLEKIGAEGVEIGVEASLNLSYRQLPPETARVFRLLSVFPATFDAPAEEQVCEDKAHASLGDLLRRSLVEFDEATQRYRLHDLVRVLAARRLDEPAHGADRLPAEQRHAEHYCATLAAADDEYLKGGDGIQAGLSLADTEWPNIQAGAAWARVHAERLPAALELASRYAGAGVHVLDLRLHPRRWADWLEVAIGAACRLGDRTAECQHLANLGGAYGRLGEPRRAIEFYKQALAIARALGDRRG